MFSKAGLGLARFLGSSGKLDVIIFWLEGSIVDPLLDDCNIIIVLGAKNSVNTILTNVNITNINIENINLYNCHN